MRLTHVRLLVTDYPTCFRFYRDVLGLPIGFGDEGGPYGDFVAGAAFLALYDRRLMDEAIGGTGKPLSAEAMDRLTLSMEVDSVDGTYEQLRARGVKFVTEPLDRPAWGIRTAHFRDPEGNLIEIYKDLQA